MSGKILVLKLWAKMLPASQIAGFFKMQYLKKEVNGEVYFWPAVFYKVFYKLIPSCWVCATSHAQSARNKMPAYLCNISRKAWRVKLIFCLQISTKVFYKLIVPLWVCLARHAQSSQSHKFTISL